MNTALIPLVCAIITQNEESFISSHSTAVLYAVVAVVILAAVLIKWRTVSDEEAGHVIVSSPTQQNSALKRISIITGISVIKAEDHNFSLVGFEDFASLLFVQYHESLGMKAVKSIQPFFNYELSNNSNFVCSQVVIESVSLYDIRTEKDTIYIVLEFSANYISKVRPAVEITSHREHCIERWLFCRNRKYTSPQQPEDLGSFSGFCNDWKVSSVNLVSAVRIDAKPKPFFDTLPHVPASAPAPAKVNDLETMFCNYHRGEYNNFAHFCKNTASPCFLSLWRNFENEGWKQPFKCTLSANTVNMLQNHHNRISQNGLIPKIKDMEIREIGVIDYIADNFFESITVQIELSCFDYIENSQGKTVVGSTTESKDSTVLVTFCAPHRKVFDRKSEFIVYWIQKK
ncbi:MAG: hypothetical protein IKQ70_09055 [Bacteroidales bacterium]|nr:hypothetical protein [Bacteroidales bacterium]